MCAISVRHSQCTAIGMVRGVWGKRTLLGFFKFSRSLGSKRPKIKLSQLKSSQAFCQTATISLHHFVVNELFNTISN